jgi:hypothetical protein
MKHPVCTEQLLSSIERLVRKHFEVKKELAIEKGMAALNFAVRGVNIIPDAHKLLETDLWDNFSPKWFDYEDLKYELVRVGGYHSKLWLNRAQSLIASLIISALHEEESFADHLQNAWELVGLIEKIPPGLEPVKLLDLSEIEGKGKVSYCSIIYEGVRFESSDIPEWVYMVGETTGERWHVHLGWTVVDVGVDK